MREKVLMALCAFGAIFCLGLGIKSLIFPPEPPFIPAAVLALPTAALYALLFVMAWRQR